MPNEKPEVGMGCTQGVGSDRYPYTICEVVNEKKIYVQADDYKRTDKNGQSESQTYEYTPNPEAQKILVTLRKNGRWVRKGETLNGSAFYIGQRRAYQDPSY